MHGSCSSIASNTCFKSQCLKSRLGGTLLNSRSRPSCSAKSFPRIACCFCTFSYMPNWNANPKPWFFLQPLTPARCSMSTASVFVLMPFAGRLQLGFWVLNSYNVFKQDSEHLHNLRGHPAQTSLYPALRAVLTHTNCTYKDVYRRGCPAKNQSNTRS